MLSDDGIEHRLGSFYPKIMYNRSIYKTSRLIEELCASSSACVSLQRSPAVKYQTCGLDKTVRNNNRVSWSGPFGGGKLKAESSLVLSQARPAVWSRVP
jgi:hypothetical protein